MLYVTWLCLYPETETRSMYLILGQPIQRLAGGWPVSWPRAISPEPMRTRMRQACQSDSLSCCHFLESELGFIEEVSWQQKKEQESRNQERDWVTWMLCITGKTSLPGLLQMGSRYHQFLPTPHFPRVAPAFQWCQLTPAPSICIYVHVLQ